MLSSKQPPRNTKDMAPEPIGLLVKMRKSLGGGKQHRRNSDDISHATHSCPLSVPQMDADTAISYIRGSSHEKARTMRYSSLTTDPSRLSESTQVTHTNGKLSNGVNFKTDENANKQDSCAHQPKKSNSSIFEKQGARPKVRKSSMGEVANLVDVASKGASLVGERSNPQGTTTALSTVEPPCVEMDHPRLPVHETGWDCNSKNLAYPTGNTTSEVTADSFKMNKQTVPCSTKSKPVVLPPAKDITSKASAPMNIYIEAEIPPAFQDELSTNSLENMKELESRNVASERPIILSRIGRSVSPAQQVPESLGSACMPYTQFEDETSEERNGELPTADLRYSKSLGALLTEESQAHQADASVMPTESPNVYQSQTFSSNRYSNTFFTGDVTTNSEAAVGDGRSESDNVVKGTQEESSSKSVGSSEVKDEPPTQACSGKKHCCTCTCGNKMHPYMYVQSDRCDKKTALRLESIPLAMVEELGSPPKARTPHIAMIINSNSMFLDDDSPVKQLSKQDLDMIINWNSFSLLQENEELSKEEGELKDCTDTTKAFGAMKLSEEEINSPTDKAIPDHLQDVLGAAGGVDTISNKMAAPRVDRSSKPKGLKKLPDDEEEVEEEDVEEEEDPPPLPPRMPATPSSHSDNIRRAMSSFQYMDDDDDIPTHEFLSDIRIDFDPDTPKKSKSLPRNATQIPSTSPPEMRSMKRVKTVNMRNRFSQMFKPGSKKKRHSTHGFPDRPLPDIPPHPKLNKIGENAARRLSSYAMTNPDETAAQEGSKDGFSKDEVSKVEVDKARKQFAVSLRKISEYGWYWGPMNWDDAEARLENMPDGSFLVRDSSDDRHLLSLSFRAQGSTHHTRVEHQMGKFSFWSQPCSHGSASIVEFVEEAMRHSRSGRVLYFLRPRNPGFPPAAVQLLYPISRFQKSRSMQHMCRFVIRRHVRLDHIDSLPLPKRLKDYLKEAQYYTQEDILH